MVDMIESSKLQDDERTFSAELEVSSLQASLGFYVRTLGFTLTRKDSENKVAIVRFGDGILFLKEKAGLPSRGQGFFLRFAVEDVDAYYREVTLKGAKTLGPPELRSWGAKRFYAKDPDGFRIQFIPQKG